MGWTDGEGLSHGPGDTAVIRIIIAGSCYGPAPTSEAVIS